jgi:hypothetical protein
MVSGLTPPNFDSLSSNLRKGSVPPTPSWLPHECTKKQELDRPLTNPHLADPMGDAKHHDVLQTASPHVQAMRNSGADEVIIPEYEGGLMTGRMISKYYPVLTNLQ